MRLDAKQQVLLAIYAEYQKDVPDMSKITFSSLDMDSKVFKIAVDKLENEGLIVGAKIHTPIGSQYPASVLLTFAKMTRRGIDFVESKMDIQQELAGCEKLDVLSRKFGKLGWEVLGNFTANVLTEIAKQVL